VLRTQRSWFKSGWAHHSASFLYLFARRCKKSVLKKVTLQHKNFFIMNFTYYVYTFIFFLSYAFFYFLSYNIFIGLVYLELASLAVSVLLILNSIMLDDRYFEFFAISLMTIAGAESAVAISLLVSMSRLSVSLTSAEFSTLKS
jgi:NADH-ubiquinone oxidoreductase chain 4L